MVGVEEPAVLDDGPAAGEAVPEVGLVVAVDAGGDEHEGRRQQGARPVVGRQQPAEGAQQEGPGQPLAHRATPAAVARLNRALGLNHPLIVQYWNWLSQAGQELGYAVVKVDASETKVNLVDKLFFSIAAQIDWPGLSERVLNRLCEQTGYLLPEASEMSFCERVAERNRISADIVKINLEQALGEEVLRRRDLAKDFRMAMTRLCLARLRGGADAPITIRALTEWLTGRNLNVSAVKQHQIFNRITRTNARRLLESLIHWVRLPGSPVTLFLPDVACLAVANDPRSD